MVKPTSNLFLTFLNITSGLNLFDCFKEDQDLSSEKSIKITILHKPEYHYLLSDFIDILINFLRLNTNNDSVLQIINIQLFDTSRSYLENDSWSSHYIVAYNEKIIQTFLNFSPQVIVSKPNQVLKFFIANNAVLPLDSFQTMWIDHQVLYSSVCSYNKSYFFSPFSKRNECEWGVLSKTKPQFKRLNGYPLKISMFIRSPTAVDRIPNLLKVNPIYKDYSFPVGGLDGMILYTMSQFLNFSVEFVDGLGQQNFGYAFFNSTISGALGTVASRRAVINTNGRFLLDYGTKMVEFTVPYDSDSYCCLVPKANKLPQFLLIFTCFSRLTWMSIYAVFFICLILWYLFQVKKNFQNAYWQMYAAFHSIPFKIFPTCGQCGFLTCCILYGVIISAIIQGHFFKFFTSPTFYKDIDTLEELDQANYPVATNLMIMYTKESKLLSRLRKKEVKSKPNLFEQIAYKRNIAKLERKRDLKYYFDTHFVDNDGSPLIHMMRECFSTYHISYIVPKKSPFLVMFNTIILKIVEAGLVFKWYDDVEYALLLKDYLTTKTKKYEIKSLTLHDLQAAFALSAGGLIIANVVFFTEILFYKRTCCSKIVY